MVWAIKEMKCKLLHLWGKVMLQQDAGKCFPMCIITESWRYNMKYNLAKLPYGR